MENKDTSPPVFLTMAEAAALLCVRPQTIQNMMCRGVLKRGEVWW